MRANRKLSRRKSFYFSDFSIPRAVFIELRHLFWVAIRRRTVCRVAGFAVFLLVPASSSVRRCFSTAHACSFPRLTGYGHKQPRTGFLQCMEETSSRNTQFGIIPVKRFSRRSETIKLYAYPTPLPRSREPFNPEESTLVKKNVRWAARPRCPALRAVGISGGKSQCYKVIR